MWHTVLLELVSILFIVVELREDRRLNSALKAITTTVDYSTTFLVSGFAIVDAKIVQC